LFLHMPRCFLPHVAHVDLFCFSLSVLVVAAVVVVEVIVAGCLGWRSEAFLGSLSVCGSFPNKPNSQSNLSNKPIQTNSIRRISRIQLNQSYGQD
jgi:hypothetical protein